MAPGDLKGTPTLSLLRGFSAPVIVRADLSPESLAFLARYDTDGFSRWDAMQSLYSNEIHGLRKDEASAPDEGNTARPSELLLSLVGDLLEEALVASDDGEHKGVLAAMLRSPSEALLLEQLAEYDVEGVYAARLHLRQVIARSHEARLRDLFEANEGARPYRMDGVQSARRSLRHLSLGLLAESGKGDVRLMIRDLLFGADNLTDRLAGLGLVVESELFDEQERGEIIQTFATNWSHEKLVMDAWYATQAGSRRPGGVERVRMLEQRSDFVLTNPNRVSALYGAFARSALPSFHHASGDGYALLRDRILRLSSINPQGAARLAVPLTKHKRLDSARASLMRAALESIRAAPDLPKDVLEIASKALD